jgi:hypothetical protein
VDPKDYEIDPHDLQVSSDSDNRASDMDDEEESDPRPKCRYGSECYRQNPEHRRRFRH